MPESPSPRYVMPATPMAQRMGRLFNSTGGRGHQDRDQRQGQPGAVRRAAARRGEWRSTPVNLLSYEGKRYLVSPRGHTQWVRNMRAAGGGELRIGRRVERFTAIELPDDAKPALLREYLRRWKFEVGDVLRGCRPGRAGREAAQIAPGYPVFQITARPE